MTKQPYPKELASSDITPESLCVTHHAFAVRYAQSLWAKSTSLRDRIDISDAESASGFGLYRAAKSWDPEAGIFRAWLKQHIRYEVWESARQASIVPRSAMVKLKEMREAEVCLEGSLGRTPSNQEVCTFVGITLKEHSKLLELRNTAREAKELVEFDLSGMPGRETGADVSDKSILVSEAIAAFGPLSEDERVLMTLHYFEEIPFRDVARILGKRTDAVSRLHGQAKSRIRSFIAERVTSPEQAVAETNLR